VALPHFLLGVVQDLFEREFAHFLDLGGQHCHCRKGNGFFEHERMVIDNDPTQHVADVNIDTSPVVHFECFASVLTEEFLGGIADGVPHDEFHLAHSLEPALLDALQVFGLVPLSGENLPLVDVERFDVLQNLLQVVFLQVQ